MFKRKNRGNRETPIGKRGFGRAIGCVAEAMEGRVLLSNTPTLFIGGVNTGVVGALEAAARNGVDVEVVMNDTSEYADDFDELESSGVKVSTYPGDPGLYIHAKAIVVDAGGPSARAFAGSQNFSTASLDYNRELGVITGDTGVVSALASRIREDFAAATPWTS